MTTIFNIDTKTGKPDFSCLTSYSPLRRYPGFSNEDIGKILAADFRQWREKGAVDNIENIDKDHQPLVSLVPLEWDSEHFSIPMYRLQLHGKSSTSREEYSDAISRVIQFTKPEKGSHIAADVDIDNYSCLNALIGLNFEIMDIKRTYCTNRMRSDIDFIRMSNRTRHYKPDDYNDVMNLVRTTDFPSRFSRDEFLDKEKVKTLYEKWFHNLLSNPKNNAVVYERNNEIIACGAIGEIDYSYAGVKRRLRTGSLYTGNEKSVGAYAPVLYRLITEAIESHGIVDTSASMNNTTVCKIIESFRSYKSAATAYSLRRLIY